MSAEAGEGEAGTGGDVLPEDLQVAAQAAGYRVPDTRRRRLPGWLYLAGAAVAFVVWLSRRGPDAVLVNDGLLWAALGLAAVGAYQLRTAWPLQVLEGEALVAAARTVGFPVGHASAQLAWRGLLSRPTWRVLLYSAEDPPARRGLVLVDGIDGQVVDHLVEDNPEEWA